MKFDFTYKGLLTLLNTDGINSKGILKNAFKDATDSDLRKFKDSIPVSNQSDNESELIFEFLKQLEPLLEKLREECYSAVINRFSQKCWYVLHYNVKTTEYLNEINITTLPEAINEFYRQNPLSIFDRVELIFTPLNDDKVYGENLVVDFKIMGA